MLRCNGKVGLALVSLTNMGELVADQDAADNLLVGEHFRKRIYAILRPEDDLVEISPEHVCVIFDHLIDCNHLQLAALKIERIFSEPIDINGYAANMVIKSGLVYAGRRTPATRSPEVLYQLAEEACLAALMANKTFEMVNATNDEAADNDWHLNQRVQAAMRNHHIEFDYQPKIDLCSGLLKGGEALIRWRDSGKIIPPDEYLATLNDEVLWDLTVYGYRRILREIIDYGLTVTISYNIDPSALSQPEFLDFIRRETKLWGVEPSQIIFEITENKELNNLVESKTLLTRIHDMGFGISLDDFGAGHGNMQRIRDLPLSEIKLDRSLCGHILTNPDAAHVTQNIIKLAKTLEVTSVAEGIEDAETIEALKDFGCDVGQGFYLGAPMSISDFKLLQTDGSKNTG